MIRIVLDLNVYVADLLAIRKGKQGTPSSQLIEYVREGRCPAGPVQLLVSIPMIENFENVLVRKFGYDPSGAKEKADAIIAYAEEGPMPMPPSIVLGGGHLPFETEAQHAQSSENFRLKDDGSLFHATQDDRYVLETAFALKADILATNDIGGFRRGPYVDLNEGDVHICRTPDHAVVVATPFWIRERLMVGTRPEPSELIERLIPGSRPGP